MIFCNVAFSDDFTRAGCIRSCSKWNNVKVEIQNILRFEIKKLSKALSVETMKNPGDACDRALTDRRRYFFDAFWAQSFSISFFHLGLRFFFCAFWITSGISCSSRCLSTGLSKKLSGRKYS